MYPLGPVIDGVALNITVQSYCDSLFVGINACATAVPDLPGLAQAMVDELVLLCRMAAGAGERRAARVAPPPLPAATPPSASRRRPAGGRRRPGDAGSLSGSVTRPPGPGGAATARCARVARCSGRTWRAAPSRSRRGC